MRHRRRGCFVQLDLDRLIMRERGGETPLGGVIAGEVPRDKLTTLRKLKEVAAVEEDPTFKAI